MRRARFAVVFGAAAREGICVTLLCAGYVSVNSPTEEKSPALQNQAGKGFVQNLIPHLSLCTIPFILLPEIKWDTCMEILGAQRKVGDVHMCSEIFSPHSGLKNFDTYGRSDFRHVHPSEKRFTRGPQNRDNSVFAF